MANRWHILAAKSASVSNRPGLTNWQFGALMEKVAEQYDGVVVREATYDETRQFDDANLFQRFHWAVALNENTGLSAKILLPSGVEFKFWTDKEMEPTKRAIASDPDRYKIWMYNDIRQQEPLRFYYYESNQKTTDGREIIFCYSKSRNVSGYWLTWRQIVDHSGILSMADRDEITACNLRREAKQIALDRSK